MPSLRVSVELELDSQFIEDILVTALEGGSNYWIDGIQINHPGGAKPKDVPSAIWAAQAVVNGGSVDFRHDGENLNSMEENDFFYGVGVWISTNPSSMDIVKTNDGKFTIDTCNIDAGDADNILQYALFGKVVCG